MGTRDRCASKGWETARKESQLQKKMKRSRNYKASEQAFPARRAKNHEETEDYLLATEEALIKNTSSQESGALQGVLETVEKIAQERGLTPEEIHNLLKIALSGKLDAKMSTRLLMSLIPISIITEDSIISAVSWLCTGKGSYAFRELILKWIIVMFDFVYQKENINAVYGFFFKLLKYDQLLPFVCNVLCLLTRMENVKPFRVRQLLDLQAKKGSQPLQILLWKYKSFAPEMVTVIPSTKTKTSFRTFKHPWKTAVDNINLRIHGTPSASQINSMLVLPVCSSSTENLLVSQKQRLFSLEQLQDFPQLLQNIQYLKPPAQIGSVIGNPLLLHYFILKDNSVFTRMYYWMSHVFKEGCPWYKIMNEEDELDFRVFLEEVFKAECFLQGGFLACEEFLWESLPFWDSCCCRSQVLQLVQWISFRSISEMKTYFYQPLFQLFCTSSLCFKCDIIENLRKLLLNRLNCHTQEGITTELIMDESTAQFYLRSFLTELIHFVNRLSTVGLCLENNSTVLMNVILDFYETVSDIYLKYNLPLIVMFPPGVLYPALFSMNSATLDQLCYVMYRYRINLLAAKENRGVEKVLQRFINQVCQKYNEYLSVTTSYLWTMCVLQSFPYPQIRLPSEALEKARVKEHWKGFTIVYHPALIGYAMLFLKKLKSEDTPLNFQLIQGRTWRWYQEFLCSQELQGLNLLFESSVSVLIVRK